MQRIKIPLLAICLVLATTRAALAFTAPSAGDMWYTMYEVFYDRLVAGPLGGLLTGGVLAWGLAAAIRGSWISSSSFDFRDFFFFHPINPFFFSAFL